MYFFDKTEARCSFLSKFPLFMDYLWSLFSCKICGDQLNSEKLTLSHLQQKHKVKKQEQ